MTMLMIIPDDNNLSGITPSIRHPPEICVDYLSHEWKKEDDIWTSWKAMSKQKKEITNGVRLENASWRSWAQQKYHLRTVNPSEINWFKDNDVTWLYGPLHTEDKLLLMQSSSSSDNHGYDNNSNLSSSTTPPPSSSSSTSSSSSSSSSSTTKSKSCLKKKKKSEMLLSAKDPKFYVNSSNCNYSQDGIISTTTTPPIIPTSIIILENSNSDNCCDPGSDCETASTCSTISVPTTPISGPTKSILLPADRDNNRSNHHIRFNDQVEQCIAVESSDDGNDDKDYVYGDNNNDDNSNINNKKKDYFTICKIAPTTLKEPGYSNSNDDTDNTDYGYDYFSTNHTNHSTSSTTTSTTTSSITKSTTTSTQTTSSTNDYPSARFSWMTDDDDDDLDIDAIDFDHDYCYSNQSSSSSSSLLSSSYNPTNTIQPISNFYYSQSPPRMISFNREDVNDGMVQTENEDGDDEEEDNGLVDKAVYIANNVRDIVQWCSLMFNR